MINEILSGLQCSQSAWQGIKLSVEILNASFQIIFPLRLRRILLRENQIILLQPLRESLTDLLKSWKLRFKRGRSEKNFRIGPKCAANLSRLRNQYERCLLRIDF